LHGTPADFLQGQTMGFLKTDAEIRLENDRALHFALTPFRFLYTLWMVLGLVGMAITWGCICWFGWIVDVGPRSERARKAATAEIVANFTHDWGGPGYQVVTLKFDFSQRPSWSSIRGEYKDEPWNSPDHFWVTDPSPYSDPSGDEEAKYQTILPFTVTEEHGTMPNHGIPYCQLGHAGLFDTGLGTWAERADPMFLLNRKSGRMRRDFETVAMMTAALRSALAHLKAGQTLASEGGPLQTLGEDSFCNAEGVVPGVLTPEQVAAYRAETYKVRLPDALAIRVRYVYFGIDQAQIDEPDDPRVKREYQWRDGGAQITGMCLADLPCDPNGDGNDDALNYRTTYWDDLFRQEPPLGPGQEAAEQAMLRTATMDFWLQEARANGITNVKPLAAMHAEAERNLRAVLTGVY
jgi:hypothetical protein